MSQRSCPLCFLMWPLSVFLIHTARNEAYKLHINIYTDDLIQFLSDSHSSFQSTFQKIHSFYTHEWITFSFMGKKDNRPSRSFHPHHFHPGLAHLPLLPLRPCVSSCRDACLSAFRGHHHGSGRNGGQVMKRKREPEKAQQEGNLRPCGSPSASDVCPEGGRKWGRQKMWELVAGAWNSTVAGVDGWERRVAGPCGKLKENTVKQFKHRIFLPKYNFL